MLLFGSADFHLGRPNRPGPPIYSLVQSMFQKQASDSMRRARSVHQFNALRWFFPFPAPTFLWFQFSNPRVPACSPPEPSAFSLSVYGGLSLLSVRRGISPCRLHRCSWSHLSAKNCISRCPKSHLHPVDLSWNIFPPRSFWKERGGIQFHLSHCCCSSRWKVSLISHPLCVVWFKFLFVPNYIYSVMLVWFTTSGNRIQFRCDISCCIDL